MRKAVVPFGPVLLLCSLLCACGGGGGGSPGTVATPNPAGNSGTFFCDSISGGSAQLASNVAPGCVGCSVSDAPKAADGDLTSFASATVNVSAAGQGVTLRATAQPGVVYPAGQKATVFLTSSSGNGTQVQLANSGITLRTYLSGSLQDSVANPPNSNCGSCGPNGTPYGSVSLDTTKPFDAVEILLNPNTSSSGPNFKIYEICSNGGQH